ncbi:hypothetical protein BHE74_00048382 [Ensete ventricosum]|nr:hypothetical protein BHE74_00048382 [Ensete ventricosum]RZS22392.1 hypothetical protein BHM03_00055162 [Ensete ventricosum]
MFFTFTNQSKRSTSRGDESVEATLKDDRGGRMVAVFTKTGPQPDLGQVELGQPRDGRAPGLLGTRREATASIGAAVRA